MTCCQRTEIFLTLGDVRRIEQIHGNNDFFEMKATVAKMAPHPSLDPIWDRAHAGGERRILRHAGGEDCIFLASDGCRLPMAARPLVCRLYPYEYNPTAIKGVYAPLCPRAEGANPPLLLALLGMNRDEAEEWRKQLYREIEEEFPDVPAALKPTPTA